MSSEFGNNIEQLIEAYLDGSLDVAERRAFEQELERDAGLRAEVQTQRSINHSLRGTFVMPVMADILARAQAHMAPRPPKISFARRPLKVRLLVEVAVAAALGIAVGIGYLVWDDHHNTNNQRRLLAKISMSDFYRQREKHDFPPDWVCPPERFLATFSYKLGQPLLMAQAPGVEMKGLAYSNTLSPDTVEVVAKVENRGVIVFADRAEAGKEQEVCETSGMHLFHRKLGSLNLYELTPLDKPHVLDLLYIPKDATVPPTASPQ